MERTAQVLVLLVLVMISVVPCLAHGRTTPEPAITAADDGGRLMVPELPPGSSITVDGSDADWAGLDVATMTFSTSTALTVNGKMVIHHPEDLHDDEVLYFYIEIPSDATDSDSGPIASQDRVVVFFDLLHDHAINHTTSYEGSDDRGIQFTRGTDVQRVFVVPSGVSLQFQPGPSGLSTSSQVATSDVSGGWALEARLVPSDLGLNSFNALMGAAAQAIDVDTGNSELWPASAGASPSSWSNIITRKPFDVVLLLDQSGSMSGVKWEATKKATNHFALILGQIKDSALNTEYGLLSPAVVGDRLGLATFTWRSGALHTEGNNLGVISTDPGDYTGDMSLSSASGATPVLEGMNETFDVFGASELTNNPLARRRLVVLMSDGKHNQPSTTYNLSTDLDYQPSSTASSALRVNPVAIGTDGSVSNDLLNELKDKYGFFTADASLTEPFQYNITDASDQTDLIADLTTFFVTTILPVYNLNIVEERMGPATISSFNVRAGERNLMLFAFWDDQDDATPLTVDTPGGSMETGVLDPNLGYSYLTLDEPDSGEYTNFRATNADYLLVLLDLNVEARFGIDAQPHGTGTDIILRARLREEGQPLTGATVRAEMGKPEAGLGTLASTVSLKNCEAHPPELPPPVDIEAEAIQDQASISVDDLRPQAARIDTGQQVDPGAYRYQWADRYLQRCNLAGLPRSSAPGLQLLDDGTHGDAVADDGIYTLQLNDTEFEGSYVFRFAASGTASDGQPFKRIKQVSEYVFVDVQADASEVGSRVYSQRGSTIFREYYVIPRDQFGGYLGPSQEDEVRFEVSGTTGEIVTDVMDRGRNGVYSVLVRYEEGQDVPDVTPVVQGKPIEPQMGIPGAELGFYADGYGFDNALNLDTGFGFGGWIGVPLWNSSLYAEGEFGVTRTNITATDTVRVMQGLANLRYDVQLGGRLVPHVTAGTGFVRFFGEGDDETAFALQAGAGLSWFFTPHLGLRANGRLFRINEVRGAGGATTNLQGYLGIVVRR